MKNIYLITVFLLAVLMMLLPLMTGTSDGSDRFSPSAVEASGTAVVPENNGSEGNSSDGLKEIKVLQSATQTTETYSTEDYLFGVVAAEMPALYEEEALKAQAVAAYTYALYKAQRNVLLEYDITDDPNTDQCFITKEAAREKWGDKADEYEQKIRSAVDAVLYRKITCGGEIILAAYHAISSGTTENASDVWGGNYSYLVSVPSVCDKLSPNYLSTAAFTAEELTAALSGVAAVSGDAAEFFGTPVRTEGGSVKTIPLCGSEVSGSDIRNALSLRSADFDVAYADGTFTFTVRGYGHGIGMSQYGAHYMAMQGSTYTEILQYYYTGCEVE